MYDSFVRYQTRLIRVFDTLSKPYGFKIIDAGRSADQVFEELKSSIAGLFDPVEPDDTERRRTAITGGR